MKLLPMNKIQKKLEVGNNFMASLKKAGCPFPGNRGTVEWCLEWLKVHPEFKVNSFINCKKVSSQKKLHTERPRRSIVDKLNAPKRLSVQQTSLLATSEFQREPIESQQ